MAQNKTLTLSIIIPAYNEERYLKNCLDSIAKQTIKPDEVIVVDNNSTDKSVEIARSYDFVKIINEKEQGVVHARNRGFNAAKCDIIARIDADSVLPRAWVALIMKYYENSRNLNTAITGGGYFYNVPLPKIHGWLFNQIITRFNRFLIGHYILWGSNMALPNNLWRRVRHKTCVDPMIHEDIDLAIHLHRSGGEIAYRSKLRVGVLMRRVYNNWLHLRARLLMWPYTLRVHGIKKWVFGWIGAYFFLLASPFFIIITHPIKLLRNKL
jgi:glycosyltransferase involved in cell wall biosynthesis